MKKKIGSEKKRKEDGINEEKVVERMGVGQGSSSKLLFMTEDSIHQSRWDHQMYVGDKTIEGLDKTQDLRGNLKFEYIGGRFVSKNY